jgi:GT2 family glycosyltransferase
VHLDPRLAGDRQPNSMNSVDVVVVAYNSRGCLRTCVEPLAGTPGVSVLVVDNACPERSYEVVADMPGVEVIHTGSNGGFAYGCNEGWRVGGSEFVLFLNPDARLDRDGLMRLAQVLESDSGTAVVGPRTEKTDGTLAWSIRRFPSLRSTFARALFLHRLLPRASWADEVVRQPSLYDRTRCVDWLPGTCLLVRRSTLETVGGFDEGFFMYVEDMEFCWRVRRAGLGVVYSPDARCVHEGGRSLSRARLLPLLAASRLRYARTHGGVVGRVGQSVGIGLGEGLRTVVGRGEPGHRRGHLQALGVIVRGDEAYRLPAATGGRDRSPRPHGRRHLQRAARHLDSVQRHFVAHRLVLALLALLAVVGNELVDRLAWHERHPAGSDVAAAAVVVATFFAGSYLATRWREHREHLST